MRFFDAAPSHTDPWRLLAWVAVALIGALLAQAWFARVPELMLAQSIFLVSCVALLLVMRELPGLLALLVVLAALANGAGGAFDWFDRIVWFDEAVHTYSCFAGLAAIGWLWAFKHPERHGSLVAFCAGLGLVLGIAWEMVEGVLGDLEFVDTATDLVFDVVGATLGGVLAKVMLDPRGMAMRRR
jgi:hypothetical protein